jgi:hypothetical protein
LAEFDKDLWRKRSWERFCRATATKPEASQRIRDAAWVSDLKAIDDLEALVEWCATRCIKVVFAKKALGSYATADKVITISSRLKPRNQSVVLLHECGHHLCGGADHHDRFGMGYPQATEPSVRRTFHHRVSCLEEEIEAWHRGWKLAVRLGLNVSRDDFDAVRLDCLRSYIKWTLKPSEMEA